ncbi:sensor histidine kinase [Flavobacteriaceae bacterium M23B6Z8]
MDVNMWSKKWVQISLHIILWVAIPVVIVFYEWLRELAITAIGETPKKDLYTLFKDNALQILFTTLIGSFAFYSSFYGITSMYLQKKAIMKRWLLTAIWFIFPLGVVYLFSVFWIVYDWFFLFFLFGGYLILLVFSLLGAFLRLYHFNQKKQAEREILLKEQLTTELALLRAKIDPHFLFNTINNIDVLIETDPAKASVFLKKLSEILRFVLYRPHEDFISLSEEIAYIQKYIDLQRIRSANENFISFKIKGNPEGKHIAPMILIIFIENAMKFVDNRMKDDSIKISLEIVKDMILFTCMNTIKKRASSAIDSGGIGLKTVKQRLQLLYSDKHELSICDDGKQFGVKLQLVQ